jgi:hypothetical protein
VEEVSKIEKSQRLRTPSENTEHTKKKDGRLVVVVDDGRGRGEGLF